MKNYLIDGYNLGHKIPEVVRLLQKKDFYAAIERIIHIVQMRINIRRNRVILVFDGKKGIFDYPRSASTVEVLFSRKPQEADDIIREILRKQTDTSHWTVISSDNEILKTARDLGANFIRSEAFYASSKTSGQQDLPKESKQKYNPDNVDVNYWMKLFGNDKNEDN